MSVDPRSGEPGPGALLQLEVGAVANGGQCVARFAGRVVFVRHALPGELVTARVTEAGRGFLRAEAVEIQRPSADRVAPPCPYARPGGCGGCDFQHVAPPTQRALKAAVVREQLARIAGLPEWPVLVDPLPGGELGWRTRVRYTADPLGRLGLLRHRSHEVIPIERCLTAHPDVAVPPGAEGGWPAGSVVDATTNDEGPPTVTQSASRGARRVRLVAGAERVTRRAIGREWSIDPGGFWQVHPAAAATIAAAVIEQLDPRPGERAWDLYGGAGLFAAAIAERVAGHGERAVAERRRLGRGRVTVVEADPAGAEAARRCLSDLPEVTVVRAGVAEALANPRWRSVDLVVADPPRAGMGREVVREIAARNPRGVCAVSCDPATFARDVGFFAREGYRLAALRAFDAFPMTHHVELVGLLTT